MAVEVFDHTADIGVRVTAASLEELFAEAGRAVLALVIENPDAIELRHTVTLEIEGEDLDALFVDLLSELIYRIDAARLLLREVTIQLHNPPRRLIAQCKRQHAE